MNLGERMKDYEYVSRDFLTKRTPVIVRVDGKAFHTFTKDFDRPFDHILGESMVASAMQLFLAMQGCKLAYIQSDEASFVLTDYDNLDTHGSATTGRRSRPSALRA
jgi:tRNA(His) 5'-end guanylyltransferase